MNVLALVPARSGSKSVIGKNLQEISGTPLLEIAIRCALESNTVVDTFVSSDSDEILNLAISLGCKSIKRPLDAATDSATANDVVRDFINQLDLISNPETIIVYLQPTSPFRKKGMIEDGIEIFLSQFKPVVAICEVSQHPNKTLVINEHGQIESYLQQADPTANRQTLPRVLIPTGSLYIFSVSDFLLNDCIPVRGALPLLVSGVYALDIDTELDLKIAQKLGSANEF
jgi:CMP-N,N'-diacetyllegionaminic acid synthase